MMAARIISRSPGTSRIDISTCHSPRLSTSSTPQIDSTAPIVCRCEIDEPKNRRPISIIQTGMLAATSVTLIGDDVCSARYCSVLYKPTPSNPSSEKRFQFGHSALPRRNTRLASGSRISIAIVQRNRFSVTGGTISLTVRPTTALPAHNSGENVRNSTVDGVIFWVIGNFLQSKGGQCRASTWGEVKHRHRPNADGRSDRRQKRRTEDT